MINNKKEAAASLIPFSFITLCLGLIFFIDCLTPLGYLDWFFYIPVIIYASLKISQRFHLYIILTITMLLTVTGLFTSPPGIAFQLDLINRILGILILWMTMVLLLRQNKETDDTEQLETRLKIVLDKLDTGIVHFQVDDAITLTNKKFEKLVGCYPNELVNKSILDFIHQDNKLEFILTKEKILTNLLKSDFMDLELKRKDGKTIPVNLQMNIIHDDVANSKYLIAFISEAAPKKITEISREDEILKQLSLSRAS